jgi:hypothetical protein
MPLEIAFMEEDDIPVFAALDAAAMVNWGIAKAMQASLPPGESRQDTVEKWTRQGFQNDSESTWIKVIDTDLNNQMIAVAMWRFQLDEEKTPAQLSAPGAEVEGAAEEKKPSVMARFTVMQAMAEDAKDFKEKFIGTKPHASKRAYQG